jgi:hypothetical protein
MLIWVEFSNSLVLIRYYFPKFEWRFHVINIDTVFRYLGTTLTHQNSIEEEIKSRLQSGNACYHSVQNVLSSSLLSKNTKIKIFRNIILPLVFYGCGTWSLTVREERRLRLFEPESSLPHSQVSATFPLSSASSIQSIPRHTSWISILILPSHLHLCLPSGSFPEA